MLKKTIKVLVKPVKRLSLHHPNHNHHHNHHNHHNHQHHQQNELHNDESWQDSYDDEEHQQQHHLQHQQEKDNDTAPLLIRRRRRWYHKIRIPLGYVGVVVFGLFVFLVVSLSNPENPQAKAYEWIRGLSTFDTPAMKLWQLQQYFAMATIAYSMEIEQWNLTTTTSTSNWLNYSISECYWMSSSTDTNSSMCNEQGQIVWVQLQDNPNIINGTFPYELMLLPELAILQFTNMSRYHHDIQFLVPFPVEEPAQHSQDPLLPSLRGIFLTNNPSLYGSLPNLTQLSTNVTHLDLHSNALQDDLRTDLWGIWSSHLQYLDLSDNFFQATIPSELGLATQLRHLNLSHNALQGTIPTELQALTKLTVLDLSNNDLTGTIGNEVVGDSSSSWTNLQQLLLHQNQLQGTIPSTLGQQYLTNLQLLTLYSNSFTGTLPPQLCDDDTRDNNNRALDIVLPCQGDLECPANCTNECSCYKVNKNNIWEYN
jgi:Leucine rich repeat